MLSLRFGSPPSAFGFDLSERSVKIAQLRRHRDRVSVDLLTTISIPEGLVDNGEIKDIEKLAALLASALTPHQKPLVRAVIASLPESKTFVETIVVPKKETQSFAAQLAATLPAYLPLPPQDVYSDAVMVSETNAVWQVLVGAASRVTVAAYLDTLERLKLIPLALEVAAAAICRAIIPNDPPEARKNRAVVDLGRRRASLIVHNGESIQFTLSVPIAGDELTGSIATALNLSTDQAEKAKVTCGLDPVKCEGVLRDVLEAMVENLTKRIGEARQFYQDRFPTARDFEEILLCGGGAHLLALDQVLSSRLSIPVRVANLWEHAPHMHPPTLTTPLQYTTAVGLALRGLEVEPSL